MRNRKILIQYGCTFIFSFDQQLTDKFFLYVHMIRKLFCRTITTGVGNCGVANGDAIRAFVDATVLGDHDEYPDARVRAELALGRDGADRIAMVAGNFSMMNRGLDAIGAPVGSGLDPIAAEMGVVVPAHLRG